MNLAPEILKMRDALLERVSGKSLKEVSEIVNEILISETNNINRLAALSARVHVLREHTKKEYQKNTKPNINTKRSNLKDINPNKKLEEIKKPSQDKEETWVRVEMLKSGIVNGVRFPENVVIDVNKTDADKLEKEGLAKIVEVLDTKPTEEKESTETETAKEEKPAEIETAKEEKPAEVETAKEEKSAEV
ncbi:MAG: hypothetical protein CFH34_01273, partial [Alphaproteobacteria bacterium MarineAlpha9_Bin4]